MNELRSGQRMPALDGVRGLAALAVLVFHGWFLANWPANADEQPWLHAMQVVMASGWSGVDLFFTLSGFLLGLPFVAARAGRGAPVELGRYAARRALRILPAFWLQVLVIGVCWPTGDRSLADGLAQAALVFHLGSEPLSPWLPVWWTLPVEAGFYLCLPLLALLLRPRAWLLLVALIGAAWLYRYQLLQADLPRKLQLVSVDHLPGRLDQFVIGLLAAYAWIRADLSTRLAGRPLRVLALLALLAPLAVHALAALPDAGRAGPGPNGNPWMVGWHGYASVALLPLLWVAARGVGWLPRLLASPALRALGRCSFGLYLWHFPLMLLAREHVGLLPAGPIRPMVFSLLLLPPSLLLAAASWHWIERPALRLLRSHPTTAALQSA